MLGSADAVFIRRPDKISADLDFFRISNYAFVSCSLGHLDIALSALQKLDFSPGSRGPETILHKFCSDLIDASESMPVCFPPSFSEARLRRKIPLIDRSLFGETSPLENCLRQYQFRELADEVRSLRLEQVTRISSFEARS
jgi:hypothetical protein